jgi:hypothetical protein
MEEVAGVGRLNIQKRVAAAPPLPHTLAHTRIHLPCTKRVRCTMIVLECAMVQVRMLKASERRQGTTRPSPVRTRCPAATDALGGAGGATVPSTLSSPPSPLPSGQPPPPSQSPLSSSSPHRGTTGVSCRGTRVGALARALGRLPAGPPPTPRPPAGADPRRDGPTPNTAPTPGPPSASLGPMLPPASHTPVTPPASWPEPWLTGVRANRPKPRAPLQPPPPLTEPRAAFATGWLVAPWVPEVEGPRFPRRI